MTALPVTYGYARVSKADDHSKNPESQLRIPADHCIRDHLVYTDVASGRSLQRAGWPELMAVLQPGNTVVVAFLDRFSRSFVNLLLSSDSVPLIEKRICHPRSVGGH